MDAQEKEVHLLDYWRVLVKRRWVVYTAVSVLTTSAALGSLLMRPLYSASTRLQIESSSPNILPFQEVLTSVPDARNDFYQTQYGLIQSRRVAREAIASLRLERHPEFQVEAPALPQSGPGAEKVVEGKRIDRFLERLKVSPVRNSRLVDVSFSSHDRVLAAAAANRVAETYIAFNSQAQYNTSERATASLALQTANLQEEIDAKEKELQAYAREHGIIPLSEKQNISIKKLNDLNDSYTRAQASRIEAEARYAALRETQPRQVPEVRDSALIQELAAKSAELERRHAQLSEKYRPEWPEMMRLSREIDETRARIDSEHRQIYQQVLGAAEGAYRAALNQESYLKRAFEDTKGQSQDLSLKEIRYNNLKAEIANRRETLEALVRRQSETATSAGVNEAAAGNIRIVDPAEVPQKPSSPKILLNVLLSLLMGLALGAGLAFFFDYLDNSIKTPEEMTQAAQVPAIGLIPAERAQGSRLLLIKSSGPRGVSLRLIRAAAPQAAPQSRVELVSHEDPKSKVAEAFRELRTALLVSKAGGPPRTILVTSTQPGEGKTVVAVNLAISLAQIGRRVLLVDADLRKPRLHRLFAHDGGQGLSHYLSGTGPLRTQPWATEVPGLSIIPSGPQPPNPADLLDSERFDQIQRDLEAQGYQHIVYDSPPVLAVADPAIMAGRVEAVLLVVQAGVTARDALGHAVHRLQQVKARIVGGVLNQIDLAQQAYYGYSYGRYYGHEGAPAGASDGAPPRAQGLP